MNYRLHSKSRIAGGQSRPGDGRIRAAGIVLFLLGSLIIIRLFLLMILNHSFYTQIAAGSQELYEQLYPKRGSIFIQDTRSGEEFPLAINRDLFVVYADTRKIDDEKVAEDIVEKLAATFQYDDEKKLKVYTQLLKKDDPYEPIEQNVTEEVVESIKAQGLPGVGFVRRPYRFYPEGRLGAHLVGFVGKDEDGNDIGRYGVEGYWNNDLAGKAGFFEGAKSAGGGWIPLAGRVFEPAYDGADLVLTVDRTLQFYACDKLRQKAEEYGATSAALILMDPQTGAILATCSVPDFDPNTYNKVDSGEVYNNTAIFTPYEPGSVFKPLTMAAALNENLVGPQSPFYDKGYADGICTKPIRNALDKTYQTQTMTGVLENSINTGMVYVAQQLGKERFRHYVEEFGFGVKEGIELETESAGTIDSLSLNKGDAVDCYAATGSFGQGLTVTPLQMVTSFAALANGGKLMRPFVVSEVRYSDGKVTRTNPKVIDEVISPRASALISGMLVSVVDNGHAKSAGVKGYYIAGKTGTAQIAGPGGYSEETNHTFVGFGPVDNPKFVGLVKFEKPRRAFADSTAAPLFGDIAQFTLKYYGIPPTRDGYKSE
ncbi:MAG: hypothetical protein A3J66_02935 [Candidatus Magasanikbacteria bacterium RIFCSPHIGHO2_02_FULL_47_14]|uniref:Penicillin-binding protein transpeptidase domain-containing protein n=1 Tax=Candidatus Magasanikbacteria bacterium RIFCSPHIGHO2_02_FULL_47_14 TaxID=1798680 RepID=A0A1F6M402_9BACT|nr:MAG: hypothetical protein A3J66_02935 [Candidatus Magasanikbacteria bacterium RIFCSPHIGHO2_02_FULL_47_14]